MTGMSHLKYLVLGGAGLFGVLLLLGLPAQSALVLAVALACPLMMVFMMSSGHSGHTRNEDSQGEIYRAGAEGNPRQERLGKTEHRVGGEPAQRSPE